MRSVVYLSTYKLFALQQRIANELPCPDGHCHDGDWRVKVATGYSSMILGARLTTSIACVPLFQEESPHPPPRMAFLGCSRSSSVVDRRVTGKTVPMTLAGRRQPSDRGSGLARRVAVIIEALIPNGRERPVGKKVAARCATRVA